jgi:hypothetical protein
MVSVSEAFLQVGSIGSILIGRPVRRQTCSQRTDYIFMYKSHVQNRSHNTQSLVLQQSPLSSVAPHKLHQLDAVTDRQLTRGGVV